jgi:hypothetical protein
MNEKTASVHWEGRGKQGLGKISTETGGLKDYPYGFASRFEDDRRGTNPEEILGAAHAACFTMAFSFAGRVSESRVTVPARADPKRARPYRRCARSPARHPFPTDAAADRSPAPAAPAESPPAAASRG